MKKTKQKIKVGTGKEERFGSLESRQINSDNVKTKQQRKDEEWKEYLRKIRPFLKKLEKVKEKALKKYQRRFDEIDAEVER